MGPGPAEPDPTQDTFLYGQAPVPVKHRLRS
jgi:hypothetical protein